MTRANVIGGLSLGIAAGAAITAGAVYLYKRSGKAIATDAAAPLPASDEEPTSDSTDDPAPEKGKSEDAWSLLPLPTDDDVNGDLETNWGSTPRDLRPLFLLAEEVTGIVGAGRILSLISFGESRWRPEAHNGDGDTKLDRNERDASQNAYEAAWKRNPPLTFGAESASFGSGGLFGMLSPYFLWTGVNELRGRALLAAEHPRVIFLPRVSAFVACAYLQRLLDHYRVDDHLDIKAGWASPGYLREPPEGGRGGDGHQRVRAKFSQHAAEVGIDLDDLSTIPKRLSTKSWPGVQVVFDRLLGTVGVA